MKKYFVNTPWWFKKIWPRYTWSINTNEKNIYLTFDDGPHPIATPYVLDLLHQYNAKATFFCIGKNVLMHPDIFQRIIDEGHATGNHTHNHLNGWQTQDADYLNNIMEANQWISSSLFRPPYGRIKKSQARQMRQYNIVMWSVLSADFDLSLAKEKCLSNVTSYAREGSIVLFHDSEKAFTRMSYALPEVLKYFKEKGYSFCKIEQKNGDFGGSNNNSTSTN